METSDGFLMALRRSKGVAEGQGMVDCPGGHPEPEVRWCPVLPVALCTSWTKTVNRLHFFKKFIAYSVDDCVYCS